jgi:hypothetical protein
MFSLLKKRVSSDEFGHALFEWTWEFLSTDCGRALGRAMFKAFNASGGIAKFLEGKGIPLEKQKLHFRLYTHCAIQAGCTTLDEPTRRAITRGAISGGFNSSADYDFEKTYTTLESAYRGQHRFDQRVEQLSNLTLQLTFLPNPNVGVLNAKYLVEAFIIPRTANSNAVIQNFSSYSGEACASIATVRRAMDQMFTKVKL